MPGSIFFPLFGNDRSPRATYYPTVPVRADQPRREDILSKNKGENPLAHWPHAARRAEGAGTEQRFG